MELTDYIDWDEGRDEVAQSEAACECFNCGRQCGELHHVPEFDYMGCEDCLDEAMRLLEREASGKELWPAERQILAKVRPKPMGQALSAIETKEVA
jgi:hypothetical protein